MSETGWGVEILNVTKTFGSVTAVDHVTLRIENGKFYSFLGPSGCGKTTTLRMIAGFEDPTEGEIRIAGKNVAGLPPYQRNVNTVFQHYALFPHMTVFDNVAYGLKQRKTPYDEIKRRVGQALEMVRLSGMERRYPKQLSGGQQQRVALARALILRPQVLLLDEPLGALDLKLRKAMQLELKNLQHQVGITFIYVTHDQEEALTMSDWIAVMNAGKVLQLGRPEEIYERPNSRFVADFIGESNFIEGRVTSQEGRLTTLEAEGNLRLLAESEQTLSVGTRATVAVRPEKIRLTTTTEEGPNHFVGRVETVVYSGITTQYQVRLANGVLVTVRQQNATGASTADGSSRVNIGDTVTVTWLPQSARVLLD